VIYFIKKGFIVLDFISIQTMTENASYVSLVYALLLTFILSTLIAITYEKTYRALSYSRNYVQTLILISIVSATVMQAVGDSLARGLAIMAAMGVIRFRTNFKDPRDIIFIFASLSVGVSCGVFGFHIAIVGTFAFIIVAWILYLTPFGKSSHYDGMLRFNLGNSLESKEVLELLFKKYTKKLALITLRDIAQGNRLEYAYQIKLKRNLKHYDMVQELQQIEEIKRNNI